MHKFGGTSLADAEGYRRAGRILEAERSPGERTAVVVSAMAGMTDGLLGLVELAGRRDPAHATELRELRRRELEVTGELLPARGELVTALERDLHDIEDLLRAIWLMRSPPAAAAELIAGYGEVWSARRLARHLRETGLAADWIDARDVLTVGPGTVAPVVDWERSGRDLAAALASSELEFLVLPGFVARDPSGLPTTLGRNGSDYSASIFAALLGAGSIDIWTDVDGVLSADPRRVPEAVVLDELSYDEAMELAYFGAKVIHPGTMAPAVRHGIPIRIRNTFRPEGAGTRIGRTARPGSPVRGVASIEGMALVNVEGGGMVGVPGVAERLFGALREAGVSAVMISQGSSEHSICFAIPERDVPAARRALERAFFAEIHDGLIRPPEVAEGCAILAVVGDGMAGTPGIAGRLFGALGTASVNVRAIAQGSSERNVSVVIDAAETQRALRAVHSGFYLSAHALSVGLVGPGLVGRTLLDQLHAQAGRLRQETGIDLRLRGIATSERMLLDERGIDLADWRGRLARDGEPTDLERFARHVRTEAMPHAVMVDCTAAAAVAERYADWLERGLHIVTPNKLANTADFESWRRLRRLVRERGRHYLYETTVGAGLPIIHTLRDLIRTGDDVLRIEGILSGTLAWLFNVYDGERPFSEVVREARERGYTEPDPREDLSGMDVARKVVILARELGLELELGQLEIEGLVPAELGGGSTESFLDGLGALDGPLRARFAEARAAGEVLRFVGTVDPAGVSSVRLARYPREHAFARIRLTDNIVQFHSRRYHDNPLVVQGPGAGPEVTAGGVFADLLRLARYVGAPE